MTIVSEYHGRKLNAIEQAQQFCTFLAYHGWIRTQQRKHFSTWEKTGYSSVTVSTPCLKHDCDHETRAVLYRKRVEYIFEAMDVELYHLRDIGRTDPHVVLYRGKHDWDDAWQTWIMMDLQQN